MLKSWNRNKMTEKLVGNVYDIQGFTVHDGPGIRTEIFLKGCPLRCLWCHSPESQAPYPQVAWYEVRCIGIAKCGKCLEVCPPKALKEGKFIQSTVEKTEIQVIELERVIIQIWVNKFPVVENKVNI